MEKKNMKVKAFADQYGMASRDVLKELASLGYTTIRTATSNIPASELELVTAYFDELTGRKKKDESASGTAAPQAAPAPAKKASAGSKAPVKSSASAPERKPARGGGKSGSEASASAAVKKQEPAPA
ncbi:MAG: translation initiation factor IF-2 N-terminal domain-containing protein, partial [Lentisphaeria bacterium]|nr:translation initiation factor IF-2 N-terminal domain-containing protein [Lentisphaeria bacterium]